jgi:hypothetical protein
MELESTSTLKGLIEVAPLGSVSGWEDIRLIEMSGKERDDAATCTRSFELLNSTQVQDRRVQNETYSIKTKGLQGIIGIFELKRVTTVFLLFS